MALAVVVLARLLGRWVMRPVVTAMGLADVAGKIERAFPAFDDRLRSTVDFTTHQTPESQVMKDRVIAEAGELAGRLDLSSRDSDTAFVAIFFGGGRGGCWCCCWWGCWRGMIFSAWR